MGLDNLCKPYSWEKHFYESNNIPKWECKTHETKDLGIIYQDDNDGAYIEASVNPWPAQFWKFKIIGSDTNYEVTTGSGSLSEYFPIMKLIADGMITIKPLKTNQP